VLNFLTIWGPTGFSGKTLLHGDSYLGSPVTQTFFPVLFLWKQFPIFLCPYAKRIQTTKGMKIQYFSFHVQPRSACLLFPSTAFCRRCCKLLSRSCYQNTSLASLKVLMQNLDRSWHFSSVWQNKRQTNPYQKSDVSQKRDLQRLWSQRLYYTLRSACRKAYSRQQTSTIISILFPANFIFCCDVALNHWPTDRPTNQSSELILWSRVLVEKLKRPQPTTKFPKFYGTRRFITAFTTARHLSLSWARSIQSVLSTHFSKIHFNIILQLTLALNHTPFKSRALTLMTGRTLVTQHS
jgi:hypothetical protein